MDPRAFEDLVFALVRAEHPSAIQLRPPDAGRDTIVPAAGDRRERAWQAKHHTSGIKWSDCEASLKTAVESRDPEEVTFVFPLDLTEGKEEGLKELRGLYAEDKVRVADPWFAATLRETLLANPDIREAHIDRVLSLGEGYAQEMFRRGASLSERWSQQTAAALEGPLAAYGQQERLQDAEQAVDDGDHARASVLYEQIADALTELTPGIADAMALLAARAAAEAGDRPRAGGLYLRVSRSAAARGDSLAEYAAFRASWLLEERERWRSQAATARAAWPELPDGSIEQLIEAFERCLAKGDGDGIAEWADAACEALAAQGDWGRVADIAGRAAKALGPVTDQSPRLEIELERLDALVEIGGEFNDAYRQLTLAPVGRSAHGPRIQARWATALARTGRGPEAAERFRVAADGWRTRGGAEDEIAEAVLSEDAVARQYGAGRRLDQPGVVAVSELRGRDITPTVLADRRETAGLRAWLEDRGYEARRALTVSWSIHRRAGHLAGALRLADDLQRLFVGAEDPEQALVWALRTGLAETARKAAGAVAWPDVLARLRPDGPPWESAAAFEVVAGCGAVASDEDAARLAPVLLEAAADHDSLERVGYARGPTARRALATLLSALPADVFDDAVEEVLFEIRTTPFPPRAAVAGLALAAAAGRIDGGEPLTEVLCNFDRAHLGDAFTSALAVVGASEDAKALIARRAQDSFVALLLAAHLHLPDADDALRRRAADIFTRWAGGTTGPDEILRNDDIGMLARWAAEEHRRQAATHLVDVLADPAEVGVHRCEAARGLVMLAPGLSEQECSQTLDAVIAAGARIAAPSMTRQVNSHPNRHFARARMSAPAETDFVRSWAIEAACVLADRAGRISELPEEVQGALGEPGPVRVEALRAVRRWPQLAAVDFGELLDDEDADVRAVAAAACLESGELADGDERIEPLIAADAPLNLRCTVLAAAREQADRFPETLAALQRDPHGYVRAAAQLATA